MVLMTGRGLPVHNEIKDTQHRRLLLAVLLSVIRDLQELITAQILTCSFQLHGLASRVVGLFSMSNTGSWLTFH